MADSASSTNTANPRGDALRSLLVCRLGSIDYQEAWDLQRRVAEARRYDVIPDVLLLLEHPHTFTLGRKGKREHILLEPAELAERGIAVYEVDRGGDVTYHGPGQLVGYPILKLPPERLDYVAYIRTLERAMLDAVWALDVPASLQEGYSGVWIGEEKVCAIGVKVDAQGVTGHGFALNVNPDLSYFGCIIPCGITDKGVTSLAEVRLRSVGMKRVSDVVAHEVAAAFGLEAESITPRQLSTMLQRAARSLTNGVPSAAG